MGSGLLPGHLFNHVIRLMLGHEVVIAKIYLPPELAPRTGGLASLVNKLLIGPLGCTPPATKLAR